LKQSKANAGPAAPTDKTTASVAPIKSFLMASFPQIGGSKDLRGQGVRSLSASKRVLQARATQATARRLDEPQLRPVSFRLEDRRLPLPR
jgi:hypothetical protein